MPVGIYYDVHTPQPIIDGLRSRNVHVVTAHEDGSRRLTDRRLLTRATGASNVSFYTHDDDLLVDANRRRKIGEPFSGIIFSRARDLELIAKAIEPDDLKNRIEYIPF